MTRTDDTPDVVDVPLSRFCSQVGSHVNEELEAEESEESLRLEIERLREQLELLAEKGGEVIVELTSKLEAKDEKIEELEGTIRHLVNSTLKV